MNKSTNGAIELQHLHDKDNVNNGKAKPFIPSSQGMHGRYRGSRFGAYRVTAEDKIITIIVVFVNCLLLVLALGALFVGVFLNTYRRSYANLCPDNEWFVAAGCMLGVGAILFILVVVSFYAICTKSSTLISIYIGILVFLFIGELTAGVYCFARRAYIKDRYKACLHKAYQSDYGDPAKKDVTAAWDLFQERFDCCGVEKPLDYISSKVRNTTPPKSCGGTLEDARGRQACFRVIENEVLDNFYMIGGAAVGIALIQLISIILSFMLLRLFHGREEYE